MNEISSSEEPSSEGDYGTYEFNDDGSFKKLTKFDFEENGTYEVVEDNDNIIIILKSFSSATDKLEYLTISTISEEDKYIGGNLNIQQRDTRHKEIVLNKK